MIENMDNIIMKLEKSGCRRDIIDTVCRLFTEQNKTGVIQIFRKYRQELQKMMDENGKLIDCIDYLIYELERNNERRNS